MRLGRNVSAPSPQHPTPSADVLALRSNWKWAYLSHFLFTFNPILHLEDIQLSELEDDLASGTYSVIPTVMQRLLTSLTPHDKRMILEDWQQQLRKQSSKRSSDDDNLTGTEDAPVDFKSLTMSEKLELFYRVCEWHFHNPNSLRHRMRDDDEYANWRIQPIAFDARGDAYWLLGGNRLWKQHLPRRKTVSKTNKRKRAALETDVETATANDRTSSRRKRNIAENFVPPLETAVANKAPRSSSAMLTRRPVRDTRSQAAGLPPARPRTVGTRASSRLRGKEEEWQQVPEEWLKESIAEASKVNGKKENDFIREEDTSENQDDKEEEQSNIRFTSKLIDDGSELTSLSDLSELPNDETDKSDIESDHDNGDTGQKGCPLTPEHNYHTPDEESWETVCVTLQDWEEFTKQFENSTNSKEKAFYKLLVNNLVPTITDVMKTEVKKQVMEDALMQRKRSSRLAMKESLREAERIESRKRAEAAKELERHRRWEARVKKEEEEKLKLESMRSVRLKEKAGIFTDTAMHTGEPNMRAMASNGKTHSADRVPLSHSSQASASKSGTQTPKEDEPWELDCEICHRRGWNLDDGEELMCCEKCSKWQHIRCHDQADFIAGRTRRNWELEEFVCDACKTPTDRQTGHQYLRGKQLEQSSRLQPQPSPANYSHLPKLQLRPSHQHQQILYPLYPQQPYVSSQNWVMYNGATGASAKNGKSIPTSNDTTSGTSKVKINDFYPAAPGSMPPYLQPVYGHSHHTAARHQSSGPGDNYSATSITGVSSNLHPYQSIARSVLPRSSSSFATAHLVQSSVSSDLSTPNIYSPEHSGRYPVAPVNSNISPYAAAQWSPGGTSTPSSGNNPGHASSPPSTPQFSGTWQGFQPVGKFGNGQGKSDTPSTTSAADNFHCEASVAPIHPLPH